MWIVANIELGAKFLEHATRHVEAAKSLGLDVELISTLDLAMICTSTASRSAFRPATSRVGGLPDLAMFLDKDVEIAFGLELLGVKVMNPASSIEACADKRRMHRVLSVAGVPTPMTAILARPYPRQPHHTDHVIEVASEIGYPLVVKGAKGSFGAQVFLANGPEDLLHLLESEGLSEVILQRLIESSFGTDIRIQVAGDKVVAGLRQTSTDGRLQANLTLGGSGRAITPREDEIRLAIGATRAVGAHYAGVDLLVGPDDSRLVCEVNSNPHITKMTEITGLDCAKAIVESIVG